RRCVRWRAGCAPAAAPWSACPAGPRRWMRWNCPASRCEASPGMKLFPLRRILAASLVLLATVPALLVLWLMARASSQAVDDLAGKILTQVASSVQIGTEAHVRQVHDVLDGVFPERLAGAELERARQWLREPARFEAMAFALTRQSAAVPVFHIGNLRGEYFGLENSPEGARVGVRKPDGLGRA